MPLPTSAPQGLPFPPKRGSESAEPQKEIEQPLPTLPPLNTSAANKQKNVNTEDTRSPLEDDIEVQEVHNDDSRGEWVTDPKTGLKHRIMPKSQYDAEGNPILQIPDFNIDDLNSEANEFLAHLRVTPSKEEQRQAQAARANALRQS